MERKMSESGFFLKPDLAFVGMMSKEYESTLWMMSLTNRFVNCFQLDSIRRNDNSYTVSVKHLEMCKEIDIMRRKFPKQQNKTALFWT